MPPASGAPFGHLDAARRLPNALHVTGWAADPDTAAPVAADVYIDGVGAAVITAGLERPDVGRAYPSLGNRHGFDVTVRIAPALHTVCVYAINVGPGGNQVIGCALVGGDTVGALDATIRRPGRLELRGWAIDPDTTAAVPIHVYVDRVGAAIGTAALGRPDVERWMPGYGAAHGFDFSAPVVGSRTVCAYAISTRAKTECHARVRAHERCPRRSARRTDAARLGWCGALSAVGPSIRTWPRRSLCTSTSTASDERSAMPK